MYINVPKLCVARSRACVSSVPSIGFELFKTVASYECDSIIVLTGTRYGFQLEATFCNPLWFVFIMCFNGWV